MFVRRGVQTRKLIAAGMFLYGVLMLVAPPAVYSAPAYKVLFALAATFGTPTVVWGVIWTLTGLAGLFVKGHGSVIIMIVTMWAWVLGLWNAVWAVHAGTWGGPIWPTLIALLLSLNIGRQEFR